MSSVGKKSRSAADKSPSKPDMWPWWQLGLDNKGNYFKGLDRAELSHHIVNLRPKTDSSAKRPAEHKNQLATANISGVNFLVSVRPSAYALSSLLDNLADKWWRGRDLSVFFVAELCAGLIDLIWLPGLFFFLRLYEETKVLNQAIWLDISNYMLAVVGVVLWPVRLFKSKPKHRPAPVLKEFKELNLQPKALLAQTGIFVGLALLLILPLKGVATWQSLNYRSHEVINLASTGFLGLEQASALLAQGDPALAQEQLNSATESFNEALVVVGNLSSELSGLVGRLPVAGSKLETARAILSASQEVAAAASLVADTLEHLTSVANEETFSFGPSLDVLHQAAIDLQPHLSAAAGYLDQAESSDLPAEFRGVLETVQGQLAALEMNLASVLSLPQLLQQVLVSPEPRTYAVIFQNSSELRPTGGFAGSLALIAFEQGEIRSINIPGGGPYDFQGSLTKTIRPPEPLRLVRGSWQLQDANWFFDFPSSAAKIRWFLLASGGPEIDGLVSLNSEVVVQLLKMTGPIELPAYGKVLTADNFMRETQAAVELEYDREANRPKQFIADLAPVLFSRLLAFKGQDMLNLSSLINKSLLSRGIQLYSTDTETQARFQEFGWAGEVQTAPSDYLAVVRTNIGGGKTDQVVSEQIRHRLEVAPTGELTVRLSISRSHRGDSRDTFESRRNVSYLRFYVPQGATLLATEGFTPPPSSYYRAVPEAAEFDEDIKRLETEIGWDTSSGTRITEEFGKTVFGNWLSVSPGETRQASLVYRLPFRLEPGATWQDLRRYSIFFQRQSGVVPVDFSSEIIWPDSFRLRWQEASRQPVLGNNTFELRTDWQGDEFYGLIFEKI